MVCSMVLCLRPRDYFANFLHLRMHMQARRHAYACLPYMVNRTSRTAWHARFCTPAVFPLINLLTLVDVPSLIGLPSRNSQPAWRMCAFSLSPCLSKQRCSMKLRENKVNNRARFLHPPLPLSVRLVAIRAIGPCFK